MYSEIRGGPWLQGEGVIHTHASTTAPPGKVRNLDQEGDIHTQNTGASTTDEYTQGDL